MTSLILRRSRGHRGVSRIHRVIRGCKGRLSGGRPGSESMKPGARSDPFVHLHTALNGLLAGNSLDFCNRALRHFLVPLRSHEHLSERDQYDSFTSGFRCPRNSVSLTLFNGALEFIDHRGRLYRIVRPARVRPRNKVNLCNIVSLSM